MDANWHQSGIQQLLAAVQEAQQIVNAARAVFCREMSNNNLEGSGISNNLPPNLQSLLAYSLQHADCVYVTEYPEMRLVQILLNAKTELATNNS